MRGMNIILNAQKGDLIEDFYKYYIWLDKVSKDQLNVRQLSDIINLTIMVGYGREPYPTDYGKPVGCAAVML